jgi:serine/threonine protein phosphatase 1
MITQTASYIPNTPLLPNFSFPKEDVVFAIGDVHGQHRLLSDALAYIASQKTPGSTRHLVFLGDLIDRGPSSFETLVLASTARTLARVDNVVWLPGNHELLMCDSLDVMGLGRNVHTNHIVKMWLENGGAKFWRELIPKGTGDWSHDALTFRKSLPVFQEKRFAASVRDWPSHFKIGGVLFVHAGVAPERPLDHTLMLGQKRHMEGGASGAHFRHWAWIRKSFLAANQGWAEYPNSPHKGQSFLIVHGHTPAHFKNDALTEPHLLWKGLSRISSKARLCLDIGPLGIAGTRIDSSGIQAFCIT